LESKQASLGVRFYKSLKKLIAQIERMPEIYGRVSRDIRAVRLKKFQHVVYYKIKTDSIDVFAVLHGARHDSNWHDRV
jgi:plasmid stabilization system protein ParE